MKKNICDTLKNKKLQLVAGILAVATPFGAKAYVDNNKSNGSDISYSNSITTNYIDDGENISYDNCSDIINGILKTEYKCNDNYFSSYNFDEKINEAVTVLNNIKYDNDNYNNYSWLDVDSINSSVLEEKIKNNCISNNIELTDNINKVISMLPEIIKSNIDYIRKRYPNYNFNTFYHNLDKLYIKNEEEEANAYYDYDSNYISVSNHILDESYDNTMIVLSHELYHLIFIRDYKNKYSLNSGASIYIEGNDILRQDFIEEDIATDFAFYSKGLDIDPVFSYNNSKELINLLSKSTAVSKDKILDYWVTCDYDSFCKIFTDEMEGYKYIFSTLSSMNKALEYGDIPSGCNVDDYKKNCLSYAVLNLYKNMCINGVKDMDNGCLNFDELQFKLNDFLNDVYNLEYSNCNKSALNKSVANINAILNAYINTKYNYK